MLRDIAKTHRNFTNLHQTRIYKPLVVNFFDYLRYLLKISINVAENAPKINFEKPIPM